MKCTLEGVPFRALLDDGSQVSVVPLSVVEELGLHVSPCDIPNLGISGTAAVEIPYLGQTDIWVTLKGVQAYKMKVPFLVVEDSLDARTPNYVQLGTNISDDAVPLMSERELTEGEAAWAYSAKIKSLAWRQYMDDMGADLQQKAPVFQSQLPKSRIRCVSRKSIIIAPHSTQKVTIRAPIQLLSRRCNFVTGPLEEESDLEVKPSYTHSKAGSGKLTTLLTNKTNKSVVLRKGTPVCEVTPGNIIPKWVDPLGLLHDGGRIHTTSASDSDSGYDTDGRASTTTPTTGPTQDPDISVDCDTPYIVNSRRANVVDPTLEGEEVGQTTRNPQLTDEERKVKVVEDMNLSGLEGADEGKVKRVKEMLAEYHDVFALGKADLGKTNMVKHKIELTDTNPFKEQYRRIPPNAYDEVRNHLKLMLDMGAIRPSKSPWASAVVLARKKCGGLRFCIDLRKLNERTVRDAHSIPRIDDSLDRLEGSSWFSSLDLKAGYWQVEMDEESKALTAFTVGPLGFYECERMPFGLTNAPATFQRLMESCLGELHLSTCLIYLDDVVIFSKTLDEQIDRLEEVLAKLRLSGLRLQPSKCELFKRRLLYLGFLVSEQGVETDPEKVAAVVKWPEPKTVTQVRSFLGFANHYRKFLKGYATLAKPLNKLVSGDNSKKFNTPVQFDEKTRQAFQAIKDLVTSAPTLAYPEYGKPFELCTDASGYGLGAALYQRNAEGEKTPSGLRIPHTQQDGGELPSAQEGVPGSEVGRDGPVPQLPLRPSLCGVHRQQPADLRPDDSQA